MRKVWVIASREYNAAVRTKSFLISLVFMPVLMVGSGAMQALVDDLAGSKENKYAVIDRTPGEKLYPRLDDAAEKRNTTEVFDPETKKQNKPKFAIERVPAGADTPDAIREQRFELSERVRQGKISGFLDIGPDTAAYPPVTGDRAVVRYLSNSPTNDVFSRWANQVLNEAVVSGRITDAGLKTEQVAGLVRPVPVQVRGLLKRDPVTGAIEETTESGRVALILVPAALTALMFLVVMVGATPLMQGVIEEKMQRIAEVLLGSVRPFELMLGKLLGMMGVSLTLAAVYLGGAYWALSRWGYTEYLPTELLLWFVIFQALAVLMYGSLFIAIGAACTDAKEAQTLMMPVVVMIMLPMFALRHVITEPNSTFSTWASFFPFATPMLMMPRLGLPPGIPWWQPIIGMVGVLLTTMMCVYAAGRIFRVGILMQGKGAKLSDLARWVFRG